MDNIVSAGSSSALWLILYWPYFQLRSNLGFLFTNSPTHQLNPPTQSVELSILMWPVICHAPLVSLWVCLGQSSLLVLWLCLRPPLWIHCCPFFLYFGLPSPCYHLNHPVQQRTEEEPESSWAFGSAWDLTFNV